MISHLLVDTKNDGFLNNNEEVLRNFCYYINIYEEETRILEKNDYERFKINIDKISNLIFLMYNKNNKFKYCKSELRDDFEKLCSKEIISLIKKDYKGSLRIMLRIIQCYRKAYLDTILKKVNYNKFNEISGFLTFVIDFFDELECVCGEVWTKNTESEIRLDVGFDLNKKRKVEEDLIKSENRHKILLELMPDAVVVHQDKQIQYCNKAFVKLLGYENKEEILKKHVYEIMDIHDKYKSIYQQRMDRVMRKGNVPLAEESFLRKKDNKLIEVETTCTLIPYKDDSAVMEIMRDISEKKRIDELKQKVKEKTMLLRDAIEYDKIRNEFFANISHELKTPVNVIFSAIQLMELYDSEDSNMKYNTHKYLSIMKQNCYRLIRIVNNLIDITKIDAGFYEIHMCNCNIVNVVENITLSVSDYIEKQGVSLTFDTNVEEKIVACDPDKIERIMLNLLSNAIKFTKSGGDIYVNFEDKGDNVLISVRDTGIGIPEEKQKEVFNRFIQVDKSLSRNREGSGIGLSLVKSLVELQGGNIELKSEKGKGAQFIVSLPINIVDEDYDSSTEASQETYNNIERINIEFSDIYSNN